MNITIPTIAVEEITPSLAEEYLALNLENNRVINEPRVRAYARDMTEGRWRLTGDTIKFNTQGQLIDGQHRLRAIVLANMTLHIAVARGVEDDAVFNLDINGVRTAAQALHIAEADAKNLNDLVAAAQIVYAYFEGGLEVAGSTIGHVRMTSPESQDYVRENLERLVHGHDLSRRVYKNVRLPMSILTAGHVILSGVDRIAADEFYVRLADGSSQGVGDPLYTLPKRVADDRMNGRQILQSTGLYYLIRCWNAWRANEMLTKLQAGVNGGRRTFMPRPR